MVCVVIMSLKYAFFYDASPMSGIPRILEDTLAPHFEVGDADSDWRVYEEYLRTTRININVRQVFPKGFNPTLDVNTNVP